MTVRLPVLCKVMVNLYIKLSATSNREAVHTVHKDSALDLVASSGKSMMSSRMSQVI